MLRAVVEPSTIELCEARHDYAEDVCKFETLDCSTAAWSPLFMHKLVTRHFTLRQFVLRRFALK